MPTLDHLSPETIARLAGLELRARYIVDGFLTGQHRSPYRGQSVEFAEHREYAPGDDLRYVDWKVFGKTDRVYLKQFEAETNLYCQLAVDVSESMTYRSAEVALSKLDYAACLAAAIAHLIVGQRDSIGLTTFDDAVRQTLSPSSNPSQLAQLTRALEQAIGARPTRFADALMQLDSRLRRRGVVVLVSDLLGDVDGLLAGLARLRHRRHEVVVMQVLDTAELEFPFDETTQFEGLEAHPATTVQPRSVRRAYLAALADYLDRLRSGFRQLQIDYCLARTDEPFDEPLRRLLTARAVRRA